MTEHSRVAEDRVDGPKLLELYAGLAVAGDGAVVSGSQFSRDGEAAQAIGHRRRRQQRRLSDELADRHQGVVDSNPAAAPTRSPGQFRKGLTRSRRLT
jgi:hypothetical protein